MLVEPKTPGSVTRISLSYWRSVEELHAFAAAPRHRKAWDWWNRTVHEHPYLGIMHEVYAAPPGAWENTNINFVPFGIGKRLILIKCYCFHRGQHRFRCFSSSLFPMRRLIILCYIQHKQNQLLKLTTALI